MKDDKLDFDILEDADLPDFFLLDDLDDDDLLKLPEDDRDENAAEGGNGDEEADDEEEITPDWADHARSAFFRAGRNLKKWKDGLSGEVEEEDLEGDSFRAQLLRRQNAIVERLEEQQEETAEIPPEPQILKARLERLKEEPTGKRMMQPEAAPKEKKPQFVFLNHDLTQADNEKPFAAKKPVPADEPDWEPVIGAVVVAEETPKPNETRTEAQEEDSLPEQDAEPRAPRRRIARRSPEPEETVSNELDETDEREAPDEANEPDEPNEANETDEANPAYEDGEEPDFSESLARVPLSQPVSREEQKTIFARVREYRTIAFFGMLVVLFVFSLVVPLRKSNGQAVSTIDQDTPLVTQLMDGALFETLEQRYNNAYPLNGPMQSVRNWAVSLVGGGVDTTGMYADHRISYSKQTPTITLNGSSAVTLPLNSAYEELGYSATDLDGTDITDQVTVSGAVDHTTDGTYVLSYSVKGSGSGSTTVTRTVRVSQERVEIVDPGPYTIYLTFDDGPGEYTEELLDILAKYPEVKVTFFVTDQYPDYQDLLTREAADGHTVAIHTYKHDYSQLYSSQEAYFADLNAMNEIIFEKTGTYATIVRFPGGSSNTISARYCKGIVTQLSQALALQGYRYFDWNVTSGDAGDTTNTQTIVNNVIAGVQGQTAAGTSSVVLQHDVKYFSVAAVEQIIQWGLENGYTFLPLDMSSPENHHTIGN